MVVLGDSFTYGQAVPPGQSFPAHLERMLIQRAGAGVEVLNFGVPGYNLDEYVDQYRSFASKWEHDLVLVDLHPGDLDAPLCSVRDFSGTLWLMRNVYLSRLVIMLFRSHILPSFEGSEDARARKLRDALGRLASACRTKAARLALVVLEHRADANWIGHIEAISSRLSCPWIDCERCHAEGRQAFPTIPGEEHLTPDGNRKLASCIADWLLREHLVPAD